jgi:hypothetical protein
MNMLTPTVQVDVHGDNNNADGSVNNGSTCSWEDQSQNECD